jgi:hypothetical protein
MFPSDDGTLREARDWLRERVDEGATCPCCTQLAKVYRRRIHATLARAIITLYRHGGAGQFVHAPSLPGDTHEISQAVWWGLIQEDEAVREDRGRAGWWRVTPRGVAFILQETQVPKYARVYDGRCLGLTGDPVWISDALGAKFSYADLMAGV